MLRLLLFALLPLFSPVSSSSHWSPRLSYEIKIEPSQNVLQITGTLADIKSGTYYFILPRTQGYPLRHFIHTIEFYDETGSLGAELTSDNEWKVKTRKKAISYRYTINLQQSIRFEDQAWGGATNFMDDEKVFLNGSLTFVIPLVKGISSPIDVQWRVPPSWNVVTPWTTNRHRTSIPSHYALVRNYYTVYQEGSMFNRRIQRMNLSTIWLGSDNIGQYPQAQRAIVKVVEAALLIFGQEVSKESITLILRDSNRSNQFRASTEANSIEFNFKKGMTFEKLWQDHRESFLRLLAHEIMHTWDRREIKHASSYLHVREWGENTCWIREGFTEYFAMLNLFNAGIYDRTEFLDSMNMIYQTAAHVNAAGALSLDTSCKLFFQDQQALNYVYTEGAVLAFMLDLELREATSGVKSLPLFMRSFMSSYRYKEKTADAFIEEWKTYAPVSLRNIKSHLSRRSPTEFHLALQKMGIRMEQGSTPYSPSWEVSPNASFKWYFD